jgi:hypothetical protein
MIHYALACEHGHAFDSWFADSTAFEHQVKRKLVTCPHCGSVKVDKAIMAPRLAGARKRQSPVETPVRNEPPPPTAAPVAMLSPHEQEVRAKFKELRDQLTKNADYVGARFPKEARKMHYGEKEYRSIYGVASPEEAKDLAEEGIQFHPLPVLPDERN